MTYKDHTSTINKLEFKKGELERELEDLRLLNQAVEKAETCYNREFISLIEQEMSDILSTFKM